MPSVTEGVMMAEVMMVLHMKVAASAGRFLAAEELTQLAKIPGFNQCITCKKRPQPAIFLAASHAPSAISFAVELEL